MENQTQNQEGVKKARGKYAKILVGAVAVIALVSVAFAGWGIFKQWRMRKGVENFAETLKRLEQEDYRHAMADTYGGKTPQETLQMYIDAVEKGDYELASKYFIGEKQEKELNSLKNSDQENIKNILDALRKTKIVDMRALLEDRYEEEVRKYSTTESKEDYVNRLYDVYGYSAKAIMSVKVDGYDFSIDFRKYPNNIWKILEF